MTEPRQLSRFVVRALASFALGLALAAGCADRPTQDDEHCFEMSRWEDELHAAERRYLETGDPGEYDRTLSFDIGICDYGPGNTEWKARFPDYDVSTPPFLEWVSYCRPLPSDGVCELCEPAVSDADILAYIDEKQTEVAMVMGTECSEEDRAVLEYERGCVVRTLDDDGEPDKCCYSALIVTACSTHVRVVD